MAYCNQKADDSTQKVIESYIETYGALISKLCFSLCKNTYDADDVYQETWIKIIKSIDTYDTSRPFDIWASKVCVNCFLDMCRKNKSETHFESEEHMERLINSQRVDRAEQGDYSKLYNAFGCLTLQERVAISLFYFDDYDGKQAAQIMGKAYAHFRIILMRARNKLRKELEK